MAKGQMARGKYMERFGAKIRLIREQAKKSMKELADAMGVSVVYVSDIELGHRKPPPQDKLNKMADYLGLPRNDLAVWAAREKGYVEIDIQRKKPIVDVALALLHFGDTLTQEDANKILAILDTGNA